LQDGTRRFTAVGLIQNHRILLSRLFAAAFFAVVLTMTPRFEASVVSSVLFFGGLALVGVATVGRLWCSLYISGQKDSSLVTVGPYSVTRNPLYLFSFIGFTGVGMATETVTLSLVMPLFFAFVYPWIIHREEAFLQDRFGAEFADYRARVPRFLPRAALYVEPERWIVDTRRFRRTMVDVVWFVWLVALIELVEELHERGVVEPLYTLF
jgi:protein-S-isoprenylcysteine O-methyltransferase Ste14